MATTVYPPLTEEKILRVKVEELNKHYFRFQKENSALKFSLSNSEFYIFKLEVLIETVRQEWPRYGADESIKRLMKGFRSAKQSVQLTALRRGWRGHLGNWLVSLGCRIAGRGGN